MINVFSFADRIIQCTRWAELVAGLKFHVELSERLGNQHHLVDNVFKRLTETFYL
jgi:hypothetical protein